MHENTELLRWNHTSPALHQKHHPKALGRPHESMDQGIPGSIAQPIL